MIILCETTHLIFPAKTESGLGLAALFRLVLDLGGEGGGRRGVIDGFTDGDGFGVWSRRVLVPRRRLLRLGPLELDGRFCHRCRQRWVNEGERSRGSRVTRCHGRVFNATRDIYRRLLLCFVRRLRLAIEGSTEYVLSFAPPPSHTMPPRPRPRAVNRPASNASSSTQSTSQPSSGPALKSARELELDNDDQLFMRNRSRTAQDWKRLESIEKGLPRYMRCHFRPL